MHDLWYFDSGCSRRIIKDKNDLLNFQSMEDKYIISDDGNKRDLFLQKLQLMF